MCCTATCNAAICSLLLPHVQHMLYLHFTADMWTWLCVNIEAVFDTQLFGVDQEISFKYKVEKHYCKATYGSIFCINCNNSMWCVSRNKSRKVLTDLVSILHCACRSQPTGQHDASWHALSVAHRAAYTSLAIPHTNKLTPPWKTATHIHRTIHTSTPQHQPATPGMQHDAHPPLADHNQVVQHSTRIRLHTHPCCHQQSCTWIIHMYHTPPPHQYTHTRPHRDPVVVSGDPCTSPPLLAAHAARQANRHMAACMAVLLVNCPCCSRGSLARSTHHGPLWPGVFIAAGRWVHHQRFVGS